jgi:hypothetical protein
MPRKSAEVIDETTVEDAPEAVKAPKVAETREPGPTTTRTGAQALAVETEAGVRTFTAGGEKGERIKELLTTREDLSRKEIAELVGSSQSRVAEVARVLGLTRKREAKAAVEAEAEDVNA